MKQREKTVQKYFTAFMILLLIAGTIFSHIWVPAKAARNNAASAIASEVVVAETTMEQSMDAVTASYQIDQKLEKILDSKKYTEQRPYIILNPYKTSPLTAMVLFQTKKDYAVRVTVSGKTKATDISSTVTKMTKRHRIPVVGLYAGTTNQVKLELLNANGKTKKSFYVILRTKKLPKELKKAVIVKQHKKVSAFGLTVVSGFDTPYPFAFDERGDIRWYMSGSYDTYGYFPLSNNHFILMDGETCAQTFIKPMSQAINETDYLGRVYQTWMVEKGVHHEVIEKMPGGNLLVLTNSLKDHSEDCIQELDRNTGKVVKTLDMREIFGKQFMDMVDWAHLNTVSYNPENHCILVSVRNCNAVVKLNWNTNKIVWILADPSNYYGTKLEKYLLEPKGEDFFYQYQQHSSYEIMEDLDNNPDTIQVMMFDNHFMSKRLVLSFDGRKTSAVSIYTINEKKKTVKLFKAFENVKSKVYSNYCFDRKAGRVFYMGGCLKKALKPGHRKGIICEFDYETEELLNTYSLKNTFYRGYGLKIDLNSCYKPLKKNKNPIIGNYYTFRKCKTPLYLPYLTLTDTMTSCSIIGNFLYVHSMNHKIKRIELIGKSQSYFFKPVAQDGGDEKFKYMEFSTAVSLESVEKGVYQIALTLKDGIRYNTQESVTID